MWQQAFAEGRPEGYPLPSDELAPALGASGEAKMIWSLATSTQMAAAAQGAVCDFPPRPEMVHGKWGDDYVPGDRVAITANPPGWQIFQPWRMDVDEAVLMNTYSATIPMSSKAVGDTAAYDTVYTVTVNNGLGSGVYYSDTAVTISAYTPEIGQRFQEWVVDDPPDLTLDDPFADETTFVMPNGNVEITATYADTKAYTVTVVGGNMGSGSYREGKEVWIFADALSQGRPFEKWVVNSGGAHIQDPTQRFTSFIMPATDVTVTAAYQSPRASYYVTVNGGVGSGVYYEGDLVRIYPFDFDTDQTFKEWVINSGDISLEDPTVADNSFIMPENPVEITATYEVADRYHSVTIQSGLGGTASAGETSARAGAVIALTATADPGYGFKEWQVVSGDVGIENNHFTMPDEDVTIRAVFEKKTDTGGTSSSGRSSASSGRRDTVTAKTPSSALTWLSSAARHPAATPCAWSS